MKRRILWFGSACIILAACALSFSQKPPVKKKGVIVRAAKPYDRLKASIRGLGGDVTYEYENVDAIAARLPEDQVASLSALVDANAIYKDVFLSAPAPAENPGGRRKKGVTAARFTARGFVEITGGDIAQFSAMPLHKEGNRGQDVIVAVIDSGVAPVAALAGSVIGGESFVPEDPLPATSVRNDPHGTQVASLIAGHAGFVFDNTSLLVQSLLIHDPASVIPCRSNRFPRCPASQSVVPMIGSAPGAKIYALKVFDAGGGGAPKSRIVAAMDRLITLRRNFERGRPAVPVNGGCGAEDNPCRFNSLQVQVANLSLGGPTLFAGGDLEDEMTERLLQAGITPVVAAGDEGFAAMTGNGPGTGRGALTVGAANIAARERVQVDQLDLDLGAGILFRPSDHTQTAWFSPRGPTADGRLDPDLLAGGVGNYTQAADGTITLVEGTSFSSPTVAGAAAVLFGAVRAGSATATEVRNALIESADPGVLGDKSRAIDQGNGFLDISAALKRLRSGRASSTLPRNEPGESVTGNIRALGFDPAAFTNDVFSTRVRNLRPGEAAQFFVETKDEVNRLVVRLRNIAPELPPQRQNQYFGGDDLFVRIADAPTSFFRSKVDEFISSDSRFVIDEPQSGLVRVAIQGDWTNAGRISADLVIERQRRDLAPESADGQIRDRETIEIPVKIPFGRRKAAFELFWDNDWSAYPTNDLDMILCPPNVPLGDACDFTGATLDSPERVVKDNPVPGVWRAYVVGFTLNTKKDKFKLRVTGN